MLGGKRGYMDGGAGLAKSGRVLIYFDCAISVVLRRVRMGGPEE